MKSIALTARFIPLREMGLGRALSAALAEAFAVPDVVALPVDFEVEVAVAEIPFSLTQVEYQGNSVATEARAVSKAGRFLKVLVYESSV